MSLQPEIEGMEGSDLRAAAIRTQPELIGPVSGKLPGALFLFILG